MGITLPVQIGDTLKKIREARGKTQEEVAKSIGCTVKTYRSWEKNTGLPRLDYLAGLSDFFNVDADYLLGRIVQKTHDLDFVCKYTGLSAEAIKNAQRDDTKALSLLLEDDKFLELLEDVADLYHRTGALTVKLDDINASGINFDGIDDLDYMYRCACLEKNDIQNAFGAIVERLVPTYDTLSAAKKILREYGRA